MRNIILFALFILVACKPNKIKDLNAQEIVDKAIVASGSDKVSNSIISFQFRDKKYVAERENGLYRLSRYFTNKMSDHEEDQVTNYGYRRYLNGHKLPAALDSLLDLNRANAVNSVHYFSVLPYGLNDKAVNKKLLTSATVNNKEYYKIQVTFNEEGGGEDFDDVFVYWIGKEDFLVDYLAYSYHTNGGGMRFRELTEQCVKNGIRFVDYANYKPLKNDIQLENLDKAFEENKLKKVSEIILRNIEVTLN
ncbi:MULTISPECIES: DUF6503 family protein [Tenacibaculum]|uniref:DUF6503 family protein n=1 Tax=Tenacibaculum TaxID=104267 RepID=UPI001F0A1D8F|nr:MULTISPECIES: DUF6503 family protein [Tenacibaculum]MCH3882059.1 deoxyribose-phosphate aldolase [Tenacibaculum aquimarinum]MDO6599700.1 deoxyribose-phosphate aldolase [Tenacibaculum sp. 1_MG-2023]